MVTDDDLAKGNGRDSVLSTMKNNNSVAFPERRGSKMKDEDKDANVEKDPSKMSRIELLRAGLAHKAPFIQASEVNAQAGSSEVSPKTAGEKAKKKVMFVDTTDDLD